MSRGPRGDGAAHRASGFTLLEMVIALALTALALALAATLLADSARLSATADRRLADPRPAIALGRLRLDLQDSVAVEGGSSLLPAAWNHGPIGLVTASGERVDWRLDERRLVRTVDPTAGRPVRRALLDEVTFFRWRRLGPRLVEIEVRSWRRPVPRAGGGPGQPRRERAVDRLRVALRGAGIRGRW